MGNNIIVSQVIIPIATALIGLLGGLAGVYLGSNLSADASKQIIQVNYQNELLQQRIRILDRAAAIFGKSPGISNVWTAYLDARPEVSGSFVSLSRDLAEYNSEFNSVIHLSNIYFGPKTREALKSMNEHSSPWWTKNSDMVTNYLAAMASELKYGIE